MTEKTHEYVFVITEIRNKFSLERIESARWSLVRTRLSSDSILYVTPDIHDSDFLEIIGKNEINEITWDRIFDPFQKVNVKIKVKFTPNNIDSMNSQSESLIHEKNNQYQKIYYERKIKKDIKMNSEEALEAKKLYIEQIKINSEKFPSDMEENDALKLWKKMNFLVPPPARITEIKKTYNLSWEKFKDLVYKKY